MQSRKVANKADSNGLHMGVVHWNQSDGLASWISSTLSDLGCEVTDFLWDAKMPQRLDVVFVYGPFGSMVPLANQLLACPPSRRPMLVFRMSEPLPNPDLPEWLRYTVGVLRSRAERLAFRQRAQGEWRLDPRLRWLTARAHRFRYYGDLHWLRQQGLLSMLVVASPWTADFLRARGFDPLLASIGPYPDWGADLGLERDIPVLWLGSRGSKRRERLLKRIRAELRERGVEMLVVDGVENPYVFGQERTILLNRTKIVLNLLRKKWDSNSMRYCFAAPNRALIVTEPTLHYKRFLPGVHLVEATIEKMAETICYYLSHEEERQQIVDRAYQVTTTDWTMEKGLGQILKEVNLSRQEASPWQST